MKKMLGLPLALCLLSMASLAGYKMSLGAFKNGEILLAESVEWVGSFVENPALNRAVFFRLLQQKSEAVGLENFKAAGKKLCLDLEFSDAERHAMEADDEFKQQFINQLGHWPQFALIRLDNVGHGVLDAILEKRKICLHEFLSLSLRGVDLSRNWDALFSVVKSIKPGKLRHVNLHRCNIQSFAELSRALQRHKKHLTTFSIAENRLGGQDALINDFLAGCSNLWELNCNHCGLMGLPPALCNRQELTKLCFSGNNLSGHTADELVRVFSNLKKLTSLALDDCSLCSVAFLDGLCWENLTVSIGGENLRGALQDLEQLMREATLKGRRVKAFAGLPMITNENGWIKGPLASSLFCGIWEADLRGADWSGTDFSCEEPVITHRGCVGVTSGEDMLETGLTKYPQLESLALRGCRLKAPWFLRGLSNPEAVQHLDLRDNCFEHTERLLAQLITLKNLKTLLLDQIDAASGCATFKKLGRDGLVGLSMLSEPVRNSIRELRLYDCDLSSIYTQALIRILRSFPALERLRIVQSKLGGAPAQRDDPEQQLENLKILDLSESTIAGDSAALRTLVERTPALESLLLPSCTLEEDSFSIVKRIARWHVSLLRKLREIDLRDTGCSKSDFTELLERLGRDCPELSRCAIGGIELARENSGAVTLTDEGEALCSVKEIPEAWRAAVTSLVLPRQALERATPAFAEELVCGFAQLEHICVRNRYGRMVKKSVRELLAPVVLADVSAEPSSTEVAQSLVSSALEAEVFEQDEAFSDDEEAEDELDRMCDFFDSVVTVSGDASSSSGMAGVVRRARSMAASSAAAASAAASSSTQLSPTVAQNSRQHESVTTPSLHRFYHPKFGAITMRSRCWAGYPKGQNYAKRPITAEVVHNHCDDKSGLIDRRVLCNLAHCYVDNERGDLAHAFDIEALGWVLRHPDTRAFFFKEKSNGRRLGMREEARIAFVLPISLEVVRDTRVCTAHRHVVLTFGQNGVLHHACSHKNFRGLDGEHEEKAHRYTLVPAGHLTVSATEGRGLSFVINAGF